jgi:hypothetical protein
MTGARTGPSPLERSAAIAVALLLHLALIEFWPWQAPGTPSRPAAPPVIPVGFYRIPRAAVVAAPPQLLGRRASAGVRASPHGTIPTEVRVAEREVIDQGNGVTMTIEGNPPPPLAEPPKPEWLEMDVWVAAQPISPPRPSGFCVPGQPPMPDLAIDHEMTGKVTASYLVDLAGVATQIEIEGGAPPVLARAVSDWLHGCLFLPAHQGGKRTIARVKQSFLFEIR